MVPRLAPDWSCAAKPHQTMGELSDEWGAHKSDVEHERADPVWEGNPRSSVPGCWLTAATAQGSLVSGSTPPQGGLMRILEV